MIARRFAIMLSWSAALAGMTLAGALIATNAEAAPPGRSPALRAAEPGAVLHEQAHLRHTRCVRGPYVTPYSRKRVGWHRHKGRIVLACRKGKGIVAPDTPPRKRRPIDPRAGGPQPDPPARMK